MDCKRSLLLFSFILAFAVSGCGKQVDEEAGGQLSPIKRKGAAVEKIAGPSTVKASIVPIAKEKKKIALAEGEILVSDFEIDTKRADVAAELADGQVTRGLEFADPARTGAVLGFIESMQSLPSRMAAYDALLGFFAERREGLQEKAEQEISDFGKELSSSVKTSIEGTRKPFIDSHYR